MPYSAKNVLRGLGRSNAPRLPDSFAWMARFRRLARDFERLPETLAGLHYLAFAILMLARLVNLALQTTLLSA